MTQAERIADDDISNTPHPYSCACSRCNARRAAEKMHPPNVMPEELQRAHYIAQIVKLKKSNSELLLAAKALQMEARARNCGLRIADEAIAKAEEDAQVP